MHVTLSEVIDISRFILNLKKMKRLVLLVGLASFGRLGLMRDLHIKFTGILWTLTPFLEFRKLTMVKDEPYLQNLVWPRKNKK